MQQTHTTTEAITVANFALTRQLIRYLFAAGKLTEHDVRIFTEMAIDECEACPDSTMGMSAANLIRDFADSPHFQGGIDPL